MKLCNSGSGTFPLVLAPKISERQVKWSFFNLCLLRSLTLPFPKLWDWIPGGGLLANPELPNSFFIEIPDNLNSGAKGRRSLAEYLPLVPTNKTILEWMECWEREMKWKRRMMMMLYFDGTTGELPLTGLYWKLTQWIGYKEKKEKKRNQRKKKSSLGKKGVSGARVVNLGPIFSFQFKLSPLCFFFTKVSLLFFVKLEWSSAHSRGQRNNF